MEPTDDRRSNPPGAGSPQWRFRAKNPESTFGLYLECGMWILGWRFKNAVYISANGVFGAKNPESTFQPAREKWILGWRP
jgi:hypothetical protein